MSKFILLMGYPGAGKSTLSKYYETQGYKWYSPDNIRNELDMHKTEDFLEIINILHNRMKEDLEQGNDIIYDSTNLYRKQRMRVLKIINQYDYEKICYILTTPIDICKKRNSKRIGYSKVSEEDYVNMEKHYKEPTYDEGWDEIIKED